MFRQADACISLLNSQEMQAAAYAPFCYRFIHLVQPVQLQMSALSSGRPASRRDGIDGVARAIFGATTRTSRAIPGVGAVACRHHTSLNTSNTAVRARITESLLVTPLSYLYRSIVQTVVLVVQYQKYATTADGRLARPR